MHTYSLPLSSTRIHIRVVHTYVRIYVATIFKKSRDQPIKSRETKIACLTQLHRLDYQILSTIPL